MTKIGIRVARPMQRLSRIFRLGRWFYIDVSPISRAAILLISPAIALFNHVFGRKSGEAPWIIGEARGHCAMDNGYHFFLYCRKEHADADIYFVVSSKSPSFHQLKEDPRVVRYGSVRHLLIFLRSSLCFYTHTYSDFIYRELFSLYRGQKKLIYLHHGVLGFKKFDKRYIREMNIMDLFVVGNRLERDILVNSVGVVESKVVVAGYARYDSLEPAPGRGNYQVAYMPTHREWLRVPSDEFRNTDFFKNVCRLINSPELIDFLESRGLDFKLALHPAMQGYSHYFKPSSERIEVLTLADASPSDILRESSLLITDYSSVSWDFLYLGKPVLFYRFDLAQYEEGRSSYVSLTDEVIGDVFFSSEDVIASVITYFEADFRLPEEYARVRGNITPSFDKQNCARIYAASKMIDTPRRVA